LRSGLRRTHENEGNLSTGRNPLVFMSVPRERVAAAMQMQV
jgi:hypothetical protein